VVVLYRVVVLSEEHSSAPRCGVLIGQSMGGGERLARMRGSNIGRDVKLTSIPLHGRDALEPLGQTMGNVTTVQTYPHRPSGQTL
jgi:hypothetical protein